MDVNFFPAPSDPHGPARHALDDVLQGGTTRILVACAFFTGAGFAIMRRHLERLRAPGSCLVVSADLPTDIEAINALAREAPGKVWMHETGKLPSERGVGHALMHSKVFYAEAGDECWLWVGSHNLTARATTGANLEAAMLLAGHPSEAPFEAARQHIEICRAESSLCPMEPAPEPEGECVEVVVVNAETDGLPSDPMPWPVRLGLESAEFDWLLRPPADVRLHLYKSGDLGRGWRNAVPWASFGGTLTGLNFTNIHPESPGWPARWDEADFTITEESPVLKFSKTRPRDRGIVTQAVINIKSPMPSDELFLTAKPRAEREERTERRLLGRADDDLAKFFTRRSVQNGRLVYEVYHRGRASWQMSIDDLRESDRRLLMEDADERQVNLVNVLDERRARHPLIMRAKYRLRRRQ